MIQRAFEPVRPRALALSLTAVVAFLSHGLLDRLANATYHPPNADFHDPFWVIFHSCILVLTIVFLVIWWRRFKWGIFFAALPDLDWVFIHGQEIFHIQLPFYQKPIMHNLLHKVFDDMPPFSYLTVPNHRHNPWACLWEVALVLALLAVIYYQSKKMNSVFLTPSPGGVRLAIKLQPRASKNEIGTTLGGELKIKVTAPPVDAAANQALLDLLAEKLGCPRSAVQIIRGLTSRHKTIWINGLGAEEVMRKLF
jgi:uncharacterized protein (TIGR00251 family)